jgi:dihydroxyacetone kinase-like predicted kinase
VPSEFQQAGLAVMVEFDPGASAQENAERLGAGLAGIRVGAVAPAARDDADGRFRRGDSVGFAGDEIVAWGGAGSTLVETVGALADGAEIVTVIEGAEAPLRIEELGLTLPDGAELELRRGGTPNYSWLIAAQ